MLDKRQRFIALAEKRVNRTLKDIRLIGNLANRHNYAYTDHDAQKIVTALEAEIKQLRGKFFLGDSRSRPLFKL